MDEFIHYEKLTAIQLLVCIAIAVFGFIDLGIKNGMYCFLVQNKKFLIDAKKEEKSLFGMIMPLASMIYLIMGFVRNWRYPGWIVFPVTVFLTLGIEMFMNRNEED